MVVTKPPKKKRKNNVILILRGYYLALKATQVNLFDDVNLHFMIKLYLINVYIA